MKSNIAPQYTRASPVALALVLALFLAALALHAEANEETGTLPVRDVIQKNKEERKAILEENQAERAEWREQATGTRGELRQDVEERKVLFEENQAERAAWRTETKTETRSAIDARRTEFKALVETRKAAMQEKREEVRARLGEEVQERLNRHITTMTERMKRTLERLVALADKIESRIVKIEEARTVQLTEARSQLTEARGLIEDARNDIAYFVELATEALSSDDPKNRIGEVREATTLARDSIVAVRNGLRDAIVLIKASATNDDTEKREESAGTIEE